MVTSLNDGPLGTIILRIDHVDPLNPKTLNPSGLNLLFAEELKKTTADNNSGIALISVFFFWGGGGGFLRKQ